MDNMNIKSHGQVCGCPHHKVTPSVLIAIGGAILLDNAGMFPGLGILVAGIGLAIIGGIKLFEDRCRCC